MAAIIKAAMQRPRSTLLVLIGILMAGAMAWQAMPREANPDVTIPLVYVSLYLEGVSPEDGERLLVRPMEQALRDVEGLRRFSSRSSQGSASITLEFDAGFDPERALRDVREKVDQEASKLPDDAEDPKVMEVNVAEFPILSIGLSGPLETRQRLMIARRLSQQIESVADVLDVSIAGDRDALLDIVVDPQIMAGLNIDFVTLFNQVSRNNRLVAAGSLDSAGGRSALKVPGLIESLDDILDMPVKISGDQVVTFREVAWIQPGFKKASEFARIDGQPAVALDISKRAGANMTATIEAVRALLDDAADLLPDSLEVTTLLDQSVSVDNMLSELINNVITAVVLVFLILLAVMGWRTSLMVGLVIPGAFLFGMVIIWLLGFTLNVVVLFGLILVAGMLVDSAIVVSELADRHLRQGMAPAQAWYQAASRMSWPVIASTATTLAVFAPLLFWPGVVGQFMKYLPATVMACLLGALIMALIFLPTLGRLVTRKSPAPSTTSPAGGLYRHLLDRLLRHPLWVLIIALLLMAVVYTGYARFNHGVNFFPEVEPDQAQILVRARSDWSAEEADAIVRDVEAAVRGMDAVKALYARSMSVPDEQLGNDVIGVLSFQLVDWHQRPPARQVLEAMAERGRRVPGVLLEFREQEMGPGGGKPIELELTGTSMAALDRSVEQIRAQMKALGGFRDLEDNRSLAGVEWRIQVDREAAARLGADVTTVGNAVQLLTNGLKVAGFRPDGVDDDVDIRVRLPAGARTLDQLNQLRVQTPDGQVPISHMTTLEPAPKVGTLHRINGQSAITLSADLEDGFQASERLTSLQEALEGQLAEGVAISVAGEQEDQQESMRFLSGAFVVALIGMGLILVTQFNSFYQTALVLSAILFSTAGVLIGLLVTGQAFGVVMVGMGIIALAGIVVNNNIVLIDTYNELRRDGMQARQAALEAGCIRLRPVLLTAITTVLGLMPMVLGINVNLLTATLGIDAPSTQWWTQLSSAIAGGLTFATLLTLLLTPCMLVLRPGMQRKDATA